MKLPIFRSRRGQPWIALALAVLMLNAPGVHRAQGQDLTAVSENIVANIERSQRELGRTQSEISDQRAQLAERLNAARRSVERLREQTVAARRVADEQTLGLAQLERRVEALREQGLFQARLLAGFSDRTRSSSDERLGSEDLGGGLEWLETYTARVARDAAPQWRDSDLVMRDGRIEAVKTLRLGPVQWFWQPDTSRGGLIDDSGSVVKASLLFSDAASADGLGSLYRSGRGAVTLDPTLSRALLLAEDEETLLEHVQKGGIWVVPILLFGVFASAIAIAKAISLWRLPAIVPALAARVEKSLREGDGNLEAIREQLHGAQAELLDIGLTAQTAQQRDDRLFACLLKHKHQLERWLGAIAVTAAVSPLLGLLGTVSGMITTFKLLTLFGAGDPSSVSVGISEALVTTELGLIVAIPALLAHAAMSRKVKAYFSDLEANAVELSQLQIQGQAP